MKIGLGAGKFKEIDTKTIELNYDFNWNLRKETVLIFEKISELYNEKRGKFILTIAHDPTIFNCYVAGLWSRKSHFDLSTFWTVVEKVTRYNGKQRIPRKLKKQYKKQYSDIMNCPHMTLSKKIQLINVIKHYSKDYIFF